MRTAVVDFVSTERERIVSKNCIKFFFPSCYIYVVARLHFIRLVYYCSCCYRIKCKQSSLREPSTQVFEFSRKLNDTIFFSYIIFSANLFIVV